MNKRNLHVLTSRLRKVDPNYFRPVNEQIDLDQLNAEEHEDNEVQFPMNKDSYTFDSQLDRHTKVFMDSSEDDEDYVPQRTTRVPDTQRPLGIYLPNWSLKFLQTVH